jgi:hypothetical protein
VTEHVPAPADLLRRLRPIPTYRDHPATVGRDIDGVDPGGARRVIDIVGSAEPVFLIFLSSGCLGCRDLWQGAGDLRRAVGSAVRVIAITRGPEVEDAGAIAQLAADGATDVVMSSQAFLDYGVTGPPFYALAVGSEVRTEGVAWGVNETAEAVRGALAGPGSP